MPDTFIGEIRIFAGNFAPRGWALCDGQLLPVSQHTALFSILGTTYGGDGRSTFALPDLQGRAPMHPGRGPGLTARRLGESGGTSTVTLDESQIPGHGHAIRANPNPGDLQGPSEKRVLARTQPGFAWQSGAPDVDLASAAVSETGGGQPHGNLQPYLAMNFIVALQGEFPQRK